MALCFSKQQSLCLCQDQNTLMYIFFPLVCFSDGPEGDLDISVVRSLLLL